MNPRRREASAEEEALSRKVGMIGFLPLEEAKTYVNGPLYGLTEEVFGLQHTEHMWQFENCMRLEYLSPRYEQYRYRHDQTFVVTTWPFGGEISPLASSHLEAGTALFITLHVIGGDALVSRLPDQDRSHCLVAKDATFTIDGKNFKGDVTHYTAPVRYSSFTLYHERIGLNGEALGPSIEELIQIVESLHDLNSKAVE
jgi:hypothetical protein